MSGLAIMTLVGIGIIALTWLLTKMLRIKPGMKDPGHD